jgi:glucose/arabinose dehydrogenase
MRRTLLFVLILASCKKDAPRDTSVRPADGGDIAEPVPPAPPPPKIDRPELPPPDETLAEPPADLAKQIKLERVAKDLARPVLLTFAPGDPRKRLFVLEQHVGRVRVIENGAVEKTPYLSLEGKVSTGNEQGLLGLAFHPRFAENGKLYVSYTDRDGDTHLVEYTAAVDGDRADAKTAREVFTIEQPYSNHNGGHVEFGPDGKLYFGLGDGGSAGDPRGNGQKPTSKLAKMLRFDVDAAKPAAEIVAIGLRNPWRFDFDRKTGDLYIGDVGQDLWESVYAVEAGTLDGRNFGWNVAEGRHCYESRRCDMSKFTAPVADYPHEQGCSVTGGYVYRGAALPALDGVYFYADYCIGWIRSFRWAPDGIRQHWDWRPALDPRAQLVQVSSFGEDEAGELYVLSLDGSIHKLVPAS